MFSSISDCDFGCLIDGTLVLRADGTSVPCEQVKAGDVLLGVDTPTVVVDQVQASMPRNEVWVVTHKQPTRSYTVSSEHRLTLASRRSPSIAVERVGGQWRVRVCWMAAGGKWRTEQFTVDIADDDEEAQAEEDIFTEEEELMLMQANELPVDELDAARPEPTPIGTRRRLIEAAKAKYLSDRSQFLLRGELFEISPVQLQERWKLYDMAAPDKAKAGAVRLPVDESAEEEEEVATEVVQPRAIQSSGNVVTDASLAAQKEVLAVASAIVGHDQVAPIFTYSAIGGGKYEAIEAGVPVECVYQVSGTNPITMRSLRWIDRHTHTLTSLVCLSVAAHAAECECCPRRHRPRLQELLLSEPGAHPRVPRRVHDERRRHRAHGHEPDTGLGRE